jgi:hypothetical protein
MKICLFGPRAISAWCGCLLVTMSLIPGCGSNEAKDGDLSHYTSHYKYANESAAISVGLEPAGNPTPEESAEPAVAGVERKIIYEAEIDLVARDVSVLEEAIPRLVKEYGGYLAEVAIDRTTGEHRSGRWRARIPVEKFEDLLDAVAKLGSPLRRGQTAEDVTEQFVDLEARLRSKKMLEQRILELLKDSDAKIKDVIEVERELARVRSEVEQMEGRLRYLVNRTSLTTVLISAREQSDYLPPQSETFLARTGQAWSNSLYSLQRCGEVLAVAVISAVPWIILLVVILAPPIWYIRRRGARRSRNN